MGALAVRNLMQAAAKRSRLIPAIVRCLTVVVAVSAGVGLGSGHSAPAPSPSAEGPPVAIGGWRYEKGANDVHLFQCQEAACVPGSRVSYRFYPAGTTMSLAQYRGEQEAVIKALQQRAPQGTSIKIVAIEGDDVATLPRMYKTRRLTIAPDASQEHVHSGLLMGEKASVSLISSSRDEKAADTSYAQYALALMLLIHLPRDQNK
jgi:hypothetical protein